MAYFPMCVDLTGKAVLLVGRGPQIADKARKLQPFGCNLHFVERLEAEMLCPPPAMVVIGDICAETAAGYAALCAQHRIPVNVVDRPALCSFAFPALIVEGDLTLSVSTGGKSPAAAACIAKGIREKLPSRAGEILQWLSELRTSLSFSQRRQAAQTALSQNRPLTQDELDSLS